MRKDRKKRPRSPAKLSPELREYLAFIGAIGGQTSRRWLSKSHARQMVAIREAKRRALKQGRIEWALKRVPLPREESRSVQPRPAVRTPRLVGTLGADSM
jgi:hypothetical protein